MNIEPSAASAARPFEAHATPATTAGRPTAPFYAPMADADWQTTCFYSTPIGEPGSPERRHADVFLETLIEPAIARIDPSMRVVRADQLSSGRVTEAIYNHIDNARLLIADLSYHNVNVFHEVGYRHASRLPCVLISRIDDPISSNLKDVRTIRIDTRSIVDFVPNIESYQSEIEKYARSALLGEASGFA